MKNARTGHLALALGVALTGLAAPSLAVAQTSRAAEIAEIRAQVQALNERLKKLEAEEPADAPAASPASSQQPPASETAVATAPAGLAAPDRGVVRQVPAPLDRPQQDNQARVEFTASSSNSEVAIKLGGGWSGVTLADATHAGWATDSGWTVTLSSPLSKGADFTTIATLDKLASGTALKLQWGQFRVKVRQGATDQAVAEITAAARAECVAQAKASKQPTKPCETPFIDDRFIEKYQKARYGEFMQAFFPAAPAFAYGLEGGVGYKSFSYLDAATAAKHDTIRNSLSAKAYVSIYPYGDPSSLTAALSYQHAFKDAKSSTLCPTPGGPGPLVCMTGAVGKPLNDDAFLASLEARREFATIGIPFTKKIAVSAQVTRDFHANVTGVDVPVYFVPDEKGNLIGGIRFGWTSEKNDATFGLFVGSAFSLF